ncbi:MAG TPA: PLDc N-terminal domain-containing protein [Acidimicrobiales bacterium]|nr:PLDc N-terminal domain-containing protein [Acidimicrobiales bacterium]
MLAYDFPLMDVFLTVLMFFGLLVVALIIAFCIFDNLRRTDHGGWAKAGWTLLILVLPLLGSLIYAAARPPSDVGGPIALA